MIANPWNVPPPWLYAYKGRVKLGKLDWLKSPSVPGQPKFRPAPPTFTSSHVFCPTSLMCIRPVPGWNVKVNGFRTPAAQIARFAPVVVPLIPAILVGLSFGIVPSALMRRILPCRVVMDCALAPFALSPTAT